MVSEQKVYRQCNGLLKPCSDLAGRCFRWVFGITMELRKSQRAIVNIFCSITMPSMSSKISTSSSLLSSENSGCYPGNQTAMLPSKSGLEVQNVEEAEQRPSSARSLKTVWIPWRHHCRFRLLLETEMIKGNLHGTASYLALPSQELLKSYRD